MVLTLVLGCGDESAPTDLEKYLGDWEIDGGDYDQDCGAGVQTLSFTREHQLRVVEGASSHLLLQYFGTEISADPPVCEFSFSASNSSVTLQVEQACVHDGATETWHKSFARVSDLSGNFVFETHLTDTNGCVVTSRPRYRPID
ncbi:MAG TPA: hypothetical protein VGK73_06635 [Polyangiaceae bacterium]